MEAGGSLEAKSVPAWDLEARPAKNVRGAEEGRAGTGPAMFKGWPGAIAALQSQTAFLFPNKCVSTANINKIQPPEYHSETLLPTYSEQICWHCDLYLLIQYPIR